MPVQFRHGTYLPNLSGNWNDEEGGARRGPAVSDRNHLNLSSSRARLKLSGRSLKARFTIASEARGRG